MKQDERSIKILQNFEPKEGYHLGFSGGKDSQCVEHIAKRSGVKYQSYFCRTSVDPPEMLEFIKANYPEVIWLEPKLTMYQLIRKKKMLPTRLMRFCCTYLKEYAGHNSVVVTGIRSEESRNRAMRPVVDYNEQQNKVIVNPIKKWKVSYIFNYMTKHKIKWCKLYNEGFGRVGCIGCPMASESNRKKEFMRYPNHKIAYLNTIEAMMDEDKLFPDFKNKQQVFDWWLSGDNAEKYLYENYDKMQSDSFFDFFDSEQVKCT